MRPAEQRQKPGRSPSVGVGAQRLRHTLALQPAAIEPALRLLRGAFDQFTGAARVVGRRLERHSSGTVTISA